MAFAVDIFADTLAEVGFDEDSVCWLILSLKSLEKLKCCDHTTINLRHFKIFCNETNISLCDVYFCISINRSNK